jgi:hypothetical protein
VEYEQAKQIDICTEQKREIDKNKLKNK